MKRPFLSGNDHPAHFLLPTIAEFVGTFAFVFIGAGVIVTNSYRPGS